jgi:hypothetical protein
MATKFRSLEAERRRLEIQEALAVATNMQLLASRWTSNRWRKLLNTTIAPKSEKFARRYSFISTMKALIEFQKRRQGQYFKE